MPALATISVNDAESTPVAHAFSPVSTDGAQARLANRTSGTTPLGWETLNIEVKAPTSPEGATKVILSMYDPTEVTVSGVTSVDRANSMKIEVNYSRKSTSQERLNLLAMISNLLANATVKTVAQNLEPIY